MIKLVSVDMDMTFWIAKRNYWVPESAFEAIRYLKEKGVLIAVNSGRDITEYSQCPEFFNYGFDYIITCNGMVTYDKDLKMVDKHLLGEEIKKELYDFFNERGEGLCFKFPFGFKTMCHKEKMYECNRHYFGQTERPNDHMDKDDHGYESSGGVCTLSPEHLKEAEERFPDLYFVDVFKNQVFDVGYKGTGKGIALLTLLDKLGIKADECMAIGDGANDIEALQSVKYSICMGNGADELKKICYDVTDTIENDGLYKAIRKYI